MLDLLKREGATQAQAESVAEAVIRHQDLGEMGSVTSVTAVVLLATIFGELVRPFLLLLYIPPPLSTVALS